MRRKATFVAGFVGLIGALVACGSSDGGDHAPDCAKHPTAKGCKSAATSSTGTTMTQVPPATVPPPAVVPPDAGVDAARPRKPDGGTPQIPQPDFACRDLLNCCGHVRDTIERAACYGVGYNASSSTCANAIIAYQVFGGCSHPEFELPDIFNSDGTTNDSKSCTYLEQVCYETGDCAGYDQCNGVALPSSGGGPTGGSQCASSSDVPDSCGRSDYLCCLYNEAFYCEPYGSPCENGF
jgi:hypothetical protein